MIVRQAFRYELAPTPVQRLALVRHAGAARWAWNWGLAVRLKAYRRRGETLNAVALHRLLNRLKRTPRLAWLSEVSKCAPQEALRDLDRAFVNCWAGRRAGRQVGYPRCKKRGRCPDRFRLTGAVGVRPEGIVIPRIGLVATKEATGKFRGRIGSVTCRREADRWYAAVTVEVQRPDPDPAVGPVVGVDCGLSALAVCSDGTRIAHPCASAAAAVRRSVSRPGIDGGSDSWKGWSHVSPSQVPPSCGGARPAWCLSCGSASGSAAARSPGSPTSSASTVRPARLDPPSRDRRRPAPWDQHPGPPAHR
jgi:hypothetical protein